MRKLCILLIAATVASCFNSKKTFEATVSFEKIRVEKKGSGQNAVPFISDSIYSVSAAYYTPVDAPEYLKDSILRHTRFLFAAWFDVKAQLDLNVAVKKHFDEYSRQLAENRLPGQPFFVLDVSPEEIYQNEHIVSFAYNWMIYEGGSHPSHGKFCFVLDKNTGRKVSYSSLIEGHETEFLSIAEAEFKAQSGIKENEKIYDIYRFNDNKFHLTDNYAFTPSGLVFCYNPYDIAPYSFGLIELTLPYGKIKSLIKFP
ncbi:MAG: RsiV family protein [Prevotellaceae bacterium]|jgi:hypothetical protein|nr:RsiV family protein [Prevotellaceae bacterium]